MICDDYRDAVLDLARDVASAEDARRAGAHLEACAACAAWFDEQRALTSSLRALAAATAADRPSEGLDQRVLAAFAAHHAAGAGTGQAGRPSLPQWGGRPCPPDAGADARAAVTAAAASNRASWQPWMRAAAVLALAVGALTWWRLGATPGGPTVAGPATPAPVSRQAQAPVGPAATIATADVVRAHPTSASASGPASSAPARVPTRRTPAPRRSPAPVVAKGFVALPAAATLPAFESGEIVRVEIPVTSLPVYGIAIPPEAAGLVQADLLVGQDGQVRAARLVTNDLLQDSRTKQ